MSDAKANEAAYEAALMVYFLGRAKFHEEYMKHRPKTGSKSVDTDYKGEESWPGPAKEWVAVKKTELKEMETSFGLTQNRIKEIKGVVLKQIESSTQHPQVGNLKN